MQLHLTYRKEMLQKMKCSLCKLKVLDLKKSIDLYFLIWGVGIVGLIIGAAADS